MTWYNHRCCTPLDVELLDCSEEWCYNEWLDNEKDPECCPECGGDRFDTWIVTYTFED